MESESSVVSGHGEFQKLCSCILVLVSTFLVNILIVRYLNDKSATSNSEVEMHNHLK